MSTRDFKPVDPIDVERELPELGARLRDALRELDTDSDDFTEGVRTRIDELAAQRRAQRHEVATLSMGWRRAASLLPPVLLPKGLAKLGVTSGGALLGKSGSLAGKGGVLGVAAVPAITLAMLVIGAWTALRSLLREPASREQHDDREWARQEVVAWWRQNLIVALLVIAGLLVLAFVAPADALTLLLVVSLLALCGVFARLAASGAASRREVGQRAGGFLMMMLLWGYGILSPTTLGRADLAGTTWIVPLLGLGGAVCLTLARAETRRRLWLGVVGTAAYVALLSALTTWSSVGIGKRPQGPDDLRAWTQRPLTDENFGTVWSQLAQIVKHWNAAGLEPLALTGIAPVARARLANREPGGEPPDAAYFALPMLELGFVDDAQAATWRDLEREREVLQKRGGSWSWRDTLSLRLAAHFDVYDELDKDDAAEAVVQSLPEPDAHQALDELLTAARTLEALDRPQRVDELRERALTTLAATWTYSADVDMGCFSMSPAALARIGRERSDPPILTSVFNSETSDGVRAMARWGVPDNVDLLALERWLNGETQQYRRAEINLWNLTAIAALAELRSLPEWRVAQAAAESEALVPPLLVELWRWRVFAAALLLASFAVFTTWRAPIRERDPEEHDWWADVRFGSKRD
ncbi:MAG: hypothetical protein DHS20C15_29500 [Planctomycetota bacterium]|nr:MAG: hypothetical protein DHS20C15_29500 [Planctomycetota bacterium]